MVGKRTKFLVLSALCLPVITSCIGGPLPYKLTAASLGITASGIFSDPSVNLKEKNYAAADYIQSKMGKNVSTYHVIQALPLDELDHPGITSPLGSAISEGVGLRLTELGYTVMLQDVAPYGNQGLYPVPKGDVNPRFVLKGFYDVKHHDVDVILHMVDTRTNAVVARFDYAMVLSREIKKLAQTPPKVYRIIPK